jgi:hypothetical protein
MGSATTTLEPTDTFLERRTVPRHQAASPEAWIVRREEASRFLRTPARLIDISDKGAQVTSDRLLFKENVLWIGLVSLPCEWVKATIRATRPEGRWRIYHLEFCEPCPCGLLEGATAESDSAPVLTWDLP